MKTNLRTSSPSQAGHSLLLVMIISMTTFLVLGGLLKWSSGNMTANVRNNQYFRTVAAAEAATEKVISHLMTDYFADETVTANLDYYRAMVPSAEESARWGNYSFSDGQGNENRTYVEHLPPDQFRVLDSEYRGLHGYASSFRVISNARELGTTFPMTAALRQDIQVAAIPLFQFAIFYNLDLEINPGPDMTVTGPVHCNKTIYASTGPSSTLRFKSDVTAVGALVLGRHPDDSSSRGTGRVIFEAEHDSGVPSLNLPIGTNNTPAGVRQIVEIPPPSESPDSPIGRQRYYNKADLILLVRDSGVWARSGVRLNNSTTPIPPNQVNSFLTNATFSDQREGRTVRALQLDIAKLRQWNTNSANPLRIALHSNDVRLVYIADQRSASGAMSAVRLVNGHTLLPKGLTIATPHPLYVKGHYNVSTNGTQVFPPGNNTTNTFPASLVGDSITILSTAWDDTNSTKALGLRNAQATTVNAAFLAGIVQTARGNYSGGVENFPRFLENWSGRVFTYNGSMVVMFDSKESVRNWPGTGTVYQPPNRAWSFDQNFTDINKLPPGTPIARTLIRGKWMTMNPGSIHVAGTAK